MIETKDMIKIETRREPDLEPRVIEVEKDEWRERRESQQFMKDQGL